MNSSPLLTCQNVTVRRRDAALLSDVSLTVSAGARIVIAGPSGAGKSTLLRAIAGLEPLTSGEVLFEGRPATRGAEILLPPHRRGVGMLLQDLGLWPSLSVRRHLQLAARDRTEVDGLLNSLGLTKLARRRPGTLSGGEQQRTALGAALAGSPRLLLLDEPFQGLDAVLKDQLLDLVDRLAASRGCAILCVTHDPAEAVRLRAQRLVILESARVIANLEWTDAFASGNDSGSPTLRAWHARLSPPLIP